MTQVPVSVHLMWEPHLPRISQKSQKRQPARGQGFGFLFSRTPAHSTPRPYIAKDSRHPRGASLVIAPNRLHDAGHVGAPNPTSQLSYRLHETPHDTCHVRPHMTPVM